MEPEPGERLTGGALRLGDLILVMRKDEIDAARMDIDRRVAKQPKRHGRALDMPAGPARAGAEVPGRLVLGRRLPQHEVPGVLLLVLVGVDTRAGLNAVVVEASELAVVGQVAILKYVDPSLV